MASRTPISTRITLGTPITLGALIDDLVPTTPSSRAARRVPKSSATAAAPPPAPAATSNSITLGNPIPPVPTTTSSTNAAALTTTHDPMMYESPTEADESQNLSDASTSSLSSPQSVSSLILRDFDDLGPRISDGENDSSDEETFATINVNPAARAAAIAAAASVATPVRTFVVGKKLPTLTASGKRRGRPPKEHTGLTPPPRPSTPKRRGRPPKIRHGTESKPPREPKKRGRPRKPVDEFSAAKIPKKRGRPFKSAIGGTSVHELLDMMERYKNRDGDDDAASVIAIDHAKRRLEYERQLAGQFDISGYGADVDDTDTPSEDENAHAAIVKRRKIGSRDGEGEKDVYVRNACTQTTHNVVIIPDSMPVSPVARGKSTSTPPTNPASKFSIRSAADIAALKAKVIAETKAAKAAALAGKLRHGEETDQDEEYDEDEDEEEYYSEMEEDDGSEKNLDEIMVHAVIGKAFVLLKQKIRNPTTTDKDEHIPTEPITAEAAVVGGTAKEGEYREVLTKQYLVSFSSWQQKPDGSYVKVREEEWRNEEELVGDWGCGGYIADFERKFEAIQERDSPSPSKVKKK